MPVAPESRKLPNEKNRRCRRFRHFLEFFLICAYRVTSDTYARTVLPTPGVHGRGPLRDGHRRAKNERDGFCDGFECVAAISATGAAVWRIRVLISYYDQFQ